MVLYNKASNFTAIEPVVVDHRLQFFGISHSNVKGGVARQRGDGRCLLDAGNDSGTELQASDAKWLYLPGRGGLAVTRLKIAHRYYKTLGIIIESTGIVRGRKLSGE